MIRCKDVKQVKGEKKTVKYEHISETFHESGGDSESEWFGCELMVRKEGDGLIYGC